MVSELFSPVSNEINPEIKSMYIEAFNAILHSQNIQAQNWPNNLLERGNSTVCVVKMA